jgi:C4-dicarboxylate transporter, DctQ subunit
MAAIFRILRRIEQWVLAWSILGITVLLVTNVFCRSLLGFSLAFAEEVSQFLIVAVTFVGLSHAAGCGRHIRMTAFYDQVPEHWRRRLMIVISSTTSLLLLVVAAYSLRYVHTVYFLETRSPVLQVPLFWVYAIVPLGLVLAAAQYGLTAWRNATSPDGRVYLSYDRLDEYTPAGIDTETPA